MAPIRGADECQLLLSPKAGKLDRAWPRHGLAPLLPALCCSVRRAPRMGGQQRTKRQKRTPTKRWKSKPAASAPTSPLRSPRLGSPGKRSASASSTPRSSCVSLISKRRRPRCRNGSPNATPCSRRRATTSSPYTPAGERGRSAQRHGRSNGGGHFGETQTRRRRGDSRRDGGGASE